MGRGVLGWSKEVSVDSPIAVPSFPVVDYSSFDWRFRQLLEALPAAVYTTDAEGRLTFYNQAAVELSGRRPELGKDQWCISWRLYWPDGRPMPHGECPMAVALREDRPIRGIEAILERPDGSRVNFLPFPTPLHDQSGVLVGGINMLVDVTDRRQAEEARRQLTAELEQRVEERTREMADALARLRVSEERFRLLVQGVSDYAIFMLDPEGHVTNWNLGAERIHGYAADEIIGQHFSRFYTEEDRRNDRPAAALDTARRAGRFDFEGWRVRADGKMFWASVVIDPIHDDSGRLVGFAKITRDLTEKRAAEEQLRQAQRMEVVGQLTGGVAHDFNNLLTAIIGNLEMLATVLPEGGAGARYAGGALRAALRGSQLTQQLLAFSRRQEIRPQLVNINSLLQETLTLCRKTLGEGIEVEMRLQADIWTSFADPAQFEAAILNLAANSRDAMERFGRLTIATENVAAGAAGIDLAAGEYVVVSVSDTGCGMDADVLARAFEPFYTTKDIGKGTGLGLSQVYGFAKQSGGGALIESRPGFGTTVRIYLPRKEGVVADQGEERAGELFAAPPVRATVLVVEDDPDVREMVVAVLSDLGYRTLVAPTGPEALALLRNENSVDLLFTDIVMPAGMSGIDLARAANRLRPDLKVLLTSGYAGAVRAAPSDRPEFPLLAKPYQVPALETKLREVLGQVRQSRRA
jgi:PAS domain S-box-containing protein